MMTDDAFDAKLAAAFAQAEPEPDDAFVEKVEKRLSNPGRRRTVLVGGAGLSGTAIAGTQLEGVFADFAVSEDAVAWMGDAAVILTYVQPETLAALAMAVMVGALAFVLPQRS